LYLVRDEGLIEFKGDRMPIGNYPKEEKSFTVHHIQLKSNDSVYLFSDGFSSQFGGENYLKFTTKRFKETLVKISKLEMEKQKQALENQLENWQGNKKQVDDILVLGIKLE
jgi:phosphoserine phosphatase RsbU/P